MLMTIYTDMKSKGLTRSARHFSTVWCGRAANYLADVEGRAASDSTALELLRRLVRAGQRDLAQQVLNSLLAASASGAADQRRGAPDQSNRS